MSLNAVLLLAVLFTPSPTLMDPRGDASWVFPRLGLSCWRTIEPSPSVTVRQADGTHITTVQTVVVWGPLRCAKWVNR